MILSTLATLLRTHSMDILNANHDDIDACVSLDLTITERLALTPSKIEAMAQSLEVIDALPDPRHRILSQMTHPNGMNIRNVAVPFGTVLIIYESRPDVTIEASAIAFKAGNRVILKGGSEALHTNTILLNLWHQALGQHDQDPAMVSLLVLDREQTREYISQENPPFDCIVPRGGEGLIAMVMKHATVPVLASGRGNNFAYIDESADIAMICSLLANGKSKMSVCNALDKVLFHPSWTNNHELRQALAEALPSVTIHGNECMLAKLSPYQGLLQIINTDNQHERETMLAREFLSADIFFLQNMLLPDAVSMINQWSGGHSAVIVSHDDNAVQYFFDHVDCSAVYHNASTRFTDGSQFGFGGEIAIATTKLHHRGPIGVEQMMTNKRIISGEGQIR